MTDKVQKIREAVENRYEYWREKESNSHSIESEIRMSECHHLLLMLNSLQEEPVSKDLEEAARRIATRHSHITGDTYYANDAFFSKKGAQWQKEQMIDKACKWLKSYRQDTPDGIGYVAGIVDDKTIKEFKQAMEDKL